MIKKIFIFALFYVGFVLGFQNDYQSTSSFDEEGKVVSSKLLANLPYSACLIDVPFVSHENCKLVSLHTGSKIFNSLYYNDNIIHGLDFNNLTVEEAVLIWKNYFISSQGNNTQFSIPTVSQLEWMLQEKLIQPLPGYYYWASEGGNISTHKRVFYMSEGTTQAANKAALLRLVNKNAPSGCIEGIDCKSFNEINAFFVSVYRENVAHTLGYELKWTVNGQQYSSNGWHDTSITRTFELPPESTNVLLDYCMENTTGCGNVLTLNPEYLNWTFKRPGFCIVSHGDVYSTWITYHDANIGGSC